MVPIVSDSLTLERGAAGRGIFVVQSETNLTGIVELFIGMDLEYELFASCYIEPCRQVDKKQQRLVVREFSGVLAKRWPLSMRNTNAVDVLTEFADKTGLAFALEDADWTKQAIPYFINIGNGFEALDLLGRELGIENFVWQSQADGVIYVGSLDACRVHKKIVGIPAEFFKDLSATGASCPLVPGFRPGKQIRIGNGEVITIDKITITAETMRINWL